MGKCFDPKLDFVFKAIFTSNMEESRIARSMKKEKMTIDIISKLTDLSHSEIEQL